jgi:hypothetical protein
MLAGQANHTVPSHQAEDIRDSLRLGHETSALYLEETAASLELSNKIAALEEEEKKGGSEEQLRRIRTRLKEL